MRQRPVPPDAGAVAVSPILRAAAPRVRRSAAGFAAATTMAVLAGCGQGPVEIPDVELDTADAKACAELVDALPDRVADQPLRAVESGGGPGAAWGDPAIVLRCGVERPDDFTRVSPCTSVNGVDWYIPDAQLEEQGDLTMTVVYRRQYVEVTLPGEYWPPATALADLAEAVDSSLEKTGACV